MARFVAPPTGWVTLGGICGLRRVSRLEAEASRLHEQRLARLTPGVAPRDVAAAVASGALPPPTRGSWGAAWPTEAVIRWAATRGLTHHM